jgi:hypothetical protein
VFVIHSDTFLVGRRQTEKHTHTHTHTPTDYELLYLALAIALLLLLWLAADICRHGAGDML